MFDEDWESLGWVPAPPPDSLPDLPPDKASLARLLLEGVLSNPLQVTLVLKNGEELRVVTTNSTSSSGGAVLPIQNNSERDWDVTAARLYRGTLLLAEMELQVSGVVRPGDFFTLTVTF